MISLAAKNWTMTEKIWTRAEGINTKIKKKKKTPQSTLQFARKTPKIIGSTGMSREETIKISIWKPFVR